jgi:hypothetical protein
LPEGLPAWQVRSPVRSRTRTEQCWDSCRARIIPVTLFPAPLFPRIQTCLWKALRGTLTCGWRRSLESPSVEESGVPRVIQRSSGSEGARSNSLHRCAVLVSEIGTADLGRLEAMRLNHGWRLKRPFMRRSPQQFARGSPASDTSRANPPRLMSAKCQGKVKLDIAKRVNSRRPQGQ